MCWRQLYDPSLLEKINDSSAKVEVLEAELVALETELANLEQSIITTNNALSEATD